MGTNETSGPELLTVAEAAAMLRVSRATAYRWIGTKELPAHRIGGTIRIDHGELLDALALTRPENDQP